MPLTVLTDDDVRSVLESLNVDDVTHMLMQMSDALHNYSTSLQPEVSGCSSANQPSRISVKGRNGATTLFMPATSDDGFGVKIVSIAESSKSSIKSDSYFPDPSRAASTTGSGASSLKQREDSVVSTTSSSSASGSNYVAEPIFDPTTPLPQEEPESPGSSTTPQGTITLLSPNGQPRAIINATTLTAFRTALASQLLFRKRTSVHTVTVFGAGQQAYWHIYLALLLRGSEIHHLHLVNRSFVRAQRLFVTLARCSNPVISDAFLDNRMRPTLLTPEYGEYDRLLKEHVRNADVIFCCTPSTTPLFPAGHLTHHGGRQKARLIAAIGSYKPHMEELPHEVLQQAVKGPHGSSKHHTGGIHLHQKYAAEGGAVVVDTIEGALKESGEVIRAGLSGQGLVEVGELVMLKRSHWAEKAAREEAERVRREQQGKEKHHGGGHGLGHLFHHHHLHHHHNRSKSGEVAPEVTKEEAKKTTATSSTPPSTTDVHDGGLRDWLERGNVVYKGVGLGLMDVVVGMAMARLADERGIGTHVADF